MVASCHSNLLPHFDILFIENLLLGAPSISLNLDDQSITDSLNKIAIHGESGLLVTKFSPLAHDPLLSLLDELIQINAKNIPIELLVDSTHDVTNFEKRLGNQRGSSLLIHQQSLTEFLQSNGEVPTAYIRVMYLSLLDIKKSSDFLSILENFKQYSLKSASHGYVISSFKSCEPSIEEAVRAQLYVTRGNEFGGIAMSWEVNQGERLCEKALRKSLGLPLAITHIFNGMGGRKDNVLTYDVLEMAHRGGLQLIRVDSFAREVGFRLGGIPKFGA